MNETVSEIMEQTRNRINTLALHPGFVSVKALEDHLAELSGLSASIIRKVRLGERTNITVATYEKLIKAIRTAEYRAIN